MSQENEKTEVSARFDNDATMRSLSIRRNTSETCQIKSGRHAGRGCASVAFRMATGGTLPQWSKLSRRGWKGSANDKEKSPPLPDTVRCTRTEQGNLLAGGQKPGWCGVPLSPAGHKKSPPPLRKTFSILKTFPNSSSQNQNHLEPQ